MAGAITTPNTDHAMTHPTTLRLWATCIALAVLCATARTAGAADEVDKQAREAELIAVLLADSPKSEKAITCKKLAIYGSAQAVPALADLLTDAELISWARIALEAIPGPEADAALRDALGKVEGRSLVGVVNSLGVREDPAAVELIIPLLKREDEHVAEAAAVALGKIGGDAAVAALKEAFPAAKDARKDALAEGLILAAEGLVAEGESKEAASLYDLVRQAEDLHLQRRLTATRGAVRSREDGLELLVTLLRSQDKPFFYIGLSTARELQGEEVSGAIAAELTTATPERAALLLKVIEDRGETVSSPVILEAVAKGEPAVRIAAIGVLGKYGDAAAIDPLIAAAADRNDDVAAAALDALANLSVEGVDEKLISLLKQAEGARRIAIMRVIGKRRVEATDALVDSLDADDGAERAAALAALGETVGPDNLTVLIERATASKHAEDRDAALAALKTACVRMGDREAAAKKLVAAMSDASLQTQCELLDILGAMEGETALATLARLGKQDRDELQDAATQVLGRWMTADAASTLLDLAKNAPGEKYRLRALRGYLRLARQFTMSDPRRAEICLTGLALADRDEERKLVLEIVERWPSYEMMRVAAQVARQSPALRQDAVKLLAATAQQVAGGPEGARELLKAMSDAPVKIEIVNATYGAADQRKDVTAALKKYVADIPLLPLPGKYNEAFGGDPAPGVPKDLVVEYSFDGKAGKATFAENAPIVLPKP